MSRISVGPVASAAALAGLLTASPALSLSGIGVYAVAPKSTSFAPNLVAATVQNNAVVRKDTLLGQSVDAVAINTFGTHVAFHRTVSGKSVISVMRVDGKSRTPKDIVDLTSLNLTFQDGRIDWPKGDWIYYLLKQYENPTRIFRVNVQTGQNQHVMTVKNNGYWHFSIAWDASWIFGMVIENNVEYLAWFTLPDFSTVSLPVVMDPTVKVAAGACGHCIGPTGTYYSKNIGSAHWARQLFSVAQPGTLQELGTYTCREWNAWSADQEFSYPMPQMYVDFVNSYYGEMFDIHVGLSICHPLNRAARNSDEWVQVQMAWIQRECNGNCNLVVMNPFDSLSLNVSRIPYSGGEELETVNVASHDFWVEAPLEDVCLPLQADVAYANRNAYWIRGLDSAGMVDAGAITTRLVPGQGTIRIDVGARSVGFSLPANAGLNVLEIYDLSGHMIRRVTEGGDRIRWDRRSSSGANAPRGTFLAKIRLAGGGTHVERLSLAQ